MTLNLRYFQNVQILFRKVLFLVHDAEGVFHARKSLPVKQTYVNKHHAPTEKNIFLFHFVSNINIKTQD